MSCAVFVKGNVTDPENQKWNVSQWDNQDWHCFHCGKYISKQTNKQINKVTFCTTNPVIC